MTPTPPGPSDADILYGCPLSKISNNSREAVSLPLMIMLETKTVARKTSEPTMKATSEKKTAPLKVPNTRNPSAPANSRKGKESFGLIFSRQ